MVTMDSEPNSEDDNDKTSNTAAMNFDDGPSTPAELHVITASDQFPPLEGDERIARLKTRPQMESPIVRATQ